MLEITGNSVRDRPFIVSSMIHKGHDVAIVVAIGTQYAVMGDGRVLVRYFDSLGELTECFTKLDWEELESGTILTYTKP